MNDVLLADLWPHDLAERDLPEMFLRRLREMGCNRPSLIDLAMAPFRQWKTERLACLISHVCFDSVFRYKDDPVGSMQLWVAERLATKLVHMRGRPRIVRVGVVRSIVDRWDNLTVQMEVRWQ